MFVFKKPTRPVYTLLQGPLKNNQSNSVLTVQHGGVIVGRCARKGQPHKRQHSVKDN